MIGKYRYATLCQALHSLLMACGTFQVIHHILAEVAVAYAMFSGEGQVYTFMVLISEVTTPEINMRW